MSTSMTQTQRQAFHQSTESGGLQASQYGQTQNARIDEPSLARSTESEDQNFFNYNH